MGKYELGNFEETADDAKPKADGSTPLAGWSSIYAERGDKTVQHHGFYFHFG